MRTSTAVILSLITATATPTFAAPLAVPDSHSVEARGFTQTATELFEAANNRIFGLTKTEATKVFDNILASNIDDVAASKLQAAMKAVSKSGSAAQKEALLIAQKNAVSRVQSGAGSAGDVVLVKLLSKGKETGVAAKAALAAMESPKVIMATAAKVLDGEVMQVTDPALDAFVKAAASKNGDAALLAGLKKTALDNFAKTGTASSAEDIKILKSLGRTGDKDVKAAFAAMTEAAQKEMGVTAIVNPPVSAVKVAAVSAGVAAGGIVAGTLLYAMAHTSVDAAIVQDLNLPATVPGGVISEDVQQQILAALAASPDQYEEAMAQIRAVSGITDEEIAMFETMDPSKKLASGLATDLSVEKMKRSLADLD